jgi:hypothetical protein
MTRGPADHDDPDEAPRPASTAAVVALLLAGGLAGSYLAVSGGLNALGATAPPPGGVPPTLPAAPTAAPPGTVRAAGEPYGPAARPDTPAVPVSSADRPAPVGRTASPAPSTTPRQGCACPTGQPTPDDSASPSPSPSVVTPSSTGTAPSPPDPQ